MVIGFSRFVLLLAAIWVCESACAQATPQLSVTTSGESDTFYDANVVQVVHLEINDSDLDRMLAALPERIYVPATFRWNDVALENVGVRYKGNSSSSPHQTHKRSFLIKFSEFEADQSFLGKERIALDNGVQFGSLFSEILVTGVLRDLNIPASRCNFAKLFLNGKYYGVYVNVERIDGAFLGRNFEDGNGALYKVDLGGPGGNLAPVPDAASFDHRNLAFEEKSKAARSDSRDVVQLIAKINETPDADFADVMESAMDMDAFLKTIAVMLFAGAFDQLTGWNPHNYYLYHDPQSGRWHYLPWDLDVGFADNAFRQIPVLAGWNAAWPIAGGPPRPLLERIIDNPRLLARYRHDADEILEKYFHPDVLIPKLDALYELIREDLETDPFPHGRATVPEDRDYESIVASIKDFIRKRYETARAQLDDPGVRPRIERAPPGRGPEPQPGKPSPDAPGELKVTGQTAKAVTLEWMDNAQGEAGHIVQRADGETGGEFRNHIGKPGGDVVTATDDRVVPGQTYRYRVYAILPTPDGPGGTGVSNTVTVRVPDR